MILRRYTPPALFLLYDTNPFLLFTQNFTALIPGTTVEILDQDSKNVIQLIITAYNVSTRPGFLFVCCQRTKRTTERDLRGEIRRRRRRGGGWKLREILLKSTNEPPADTAGSTQAGFLILQRGWSVEVGLTADTVGMFFIFLKNYKLEKTSAGVDGLTFSLTKSDLFI